VTGRRHAVIGLDPAACTVCMICAEECPVWCLDIGAHVEIDSPPGARRPVRRTVLDSFTLDYGLCMYCGICVEACPVDALHWSAAPTPPEPSRADLVHGTRRLAGWLDGPEPPPGAPR
jgi:NADH-quinone oxidoreductase subunit I